MRPRHLLALVVIGTLSFAAADAASSAAVAPPDGFVHVPPGAFVGEDAAGTFVATGARAPRTEGAADHPASCGATAPTPPNACTTGSHAPPHAWISHGFTLPFPACPVLGKPCFDGTIESRITHAGGDRLFRCDVAYDPVAERHAVKCYPGSGPFPAATATFGHACATFFRGTPVSGGLGDWSCTISH